MAEKQEQIEEIRQIIIKKVYCSKRKKVNCKMFIDCPQCQAEALYEAGLRLPKQDTMLKD